MQAVKAEAFIRAIALVKAFTDQYPLEAYEIPTSTSSTESGWPIFTSAPRTATVTPTEQALSLTKDIAEWLMEEL